MREITKYNFLADCQSTFQECSRDQQDVMNVPDDPCINFDDVVEKYANSLGYSKDGAASADSFVLTKDPDNAPVLIEFKNGQLQHSPRTRLNIREKMCNSILILEAILGESWLDLRSTMQFILVYNESKNPKAGNPKDKIRSSVGNKAAGTKDIRFGLEKYSLYYSNIRTLTESEFTSVVNSGEFHI